MKGKPKFPRADALRVARFLYVALADHCVWLVFAGSLRRRKELVGDIELVFIPKLTTQAEDFFTATSVSKVDLVLHDLIARGVIEKRRNVNVSEMWGPKNKLARHVASGIPVDFFATTEAARFNYLVCRTGGSASNMEIENFLACKTPIAQHRGGKECL